MAANWWDTDPPAEGNWWDADPPASAPTPPQAQQVSLPRVDPREAEIRTRLATGAAAQRTEQMSHAAPPPPVETAAWGDVLAAVPGQVQDFAATAIAGAKLRALQEHQQELAEKDPHKLRLGVLDEPIERERSVLNTIAAEREAKAVPNMSTLQAGVQQGLVSLPIAAPAFAAGLLTRNPAIAAATMYPVTSAEKFGSLSAGPRPLPLDLRAQHSDFQGFVEAGTELIPFAAYLDRIPGGQMILRALASELPGESVAAVLQGASDFVADAQRGGAELTPELAVAGLRDATKSLPETWIATLLGTTVQTGGMSLVNSGVEKLASQPPPLDGPMPSGETIAQGAQLEPLSAIMAPQAAWWESDPPAPAAPEVAAPVAQQPAPPSAAPEVAAPTAAPEAPATPLAGVRPTPPTEQPPVAAPTAARPAAQADTARELVTEDGGTSIFRHPDGTFSYESPQGAASGFASWDDAYDAASGKPVAAGQPIAQPAPSPEATAQSAYAESVRRYNELAREYETAGETRRAQIRSEMGALDIEQKRLMAQAQKQAEAAARKRMQSEAAEKYGAMTPGSRVGMIGYGPESYWQKLEDGRWQRFLGGKPADVFKVDAEMEGEPLPAPQRVKPPKAPKVPETGAPKRKRNYRTPDETQDSILEYLSKLKAHGTKTRGLNLKHMVESLGWGENELKKVYGSGINIVFTKGGMTLDQAAELLAEAGYPVRNERGDYDPNVLLDLIRDELVLRKKAYSDRNTTWMEDNAWDDPGADTLPPIEIPPDIVEGASEIAQELARLHEAARRIVGDDAVDAILESQADDETVRDRLLEIIERAENEGQQAGERAQPGPEAGAPDGPPNEGTTWEQSGAGQQAVIPGAERKEAGPAEALTLEGGQDLTPPPEGVQPRLALEGGAMAPPKAPDRPRGNQPPPSLGGGLFAQPAAQAPAPALAVNFGGKTYQVESVEAAAEKWVAFRDKTMAGASDIGNGIEVKDSSGKLVAKISYNGRIWSPDEWEARNKPKDPAPPTRGTKIPMSVRNAYREIEDTVTRLQQENAPYEELRKALDQRAAMSRTLIKEYGDFEFEEMLRLEEEMARRKAKKQAKPITDESRPIPLRGEGGAPRVKYRRRKGLILPARGPLSAKREGEIVASMRDQLWEQNGIDPQEAALWPADRQFSEAKRLIAARFGLVGIEKDANLQLREAIDVLLDGYVGLNNLAAMLGISDRLMGYNGKLSLRLSAGAGQALGTHQMNPDGTHVIRLVRRNDSFAHEWGHGIDYRLLLENHIPLMAAIEKGRAQTGKTRLAGVDQPGAPLAQAFVNVLNAMYFDSNKAAQYEIDLEQKIANTKGASARAKLEAQLENFRRGKGRPTAKNRDLSSTYYRDAKDIDQGGGVYAGEGYWQRPTEMFARAFEAWVSAKVEALGAANADFLGMRDYLYRRDAGPGFARMYPMAEDRIAIFDALDQLVDAMRHTDALGWRETGSAVIDTRKPRNWRDTVPVIERTNYQKLVHDLRSQREYLKRKKQDTKRLARDRFDRRQRALSAGQRGNPATLSAARNIYLAAIEQTEDLVAGALMTLRGDAFSLAKRYPTSKGLAFIKRKFFSDPGSGDPSAGRPKYVETVFAEIRRFSNRLSRIAESTNLAEWDDARKRELRDVLVGVSQPMNAEMKRVATNFRELLNDLYYYAQKRGLNLGYTVNGYLPRMIDKEVMSDRPDEFLQAATRVYTEVFDRDYPVTDDPETVKTLARLARMFGMSDTARALEKAAGEMESQRESLSPSDYRAFFQGILPDLTAMAEQIRPEWAGRAAIDWQNRIFGINEGNRFEVEPNGPTGSFMKSRQLPASADALLGDFYIHDPEALVSTYLNQNLRRSIFAEFFGAPTSDKGIGWKLDDAYNEMRRAGIEEDHIERITQAVDLMTGAYKSHDMTRKGRRLRSAVMAFYIPPILGRMFWSQVAEPTTIGMRTGRMRDVFTAHGLVARDFMKWLRLVPRSVREDVQWQEDFAESLGIVADAYADELMQNRYNLLYQTPDSARTMSRFFRMIGVHQHTNAMRRAAARIGLKFIMREMQAAADNPHGSRRWKRAYRNLVELGLRPQDEQLQEMIRWLGTRPASAEVEEHPRFRDLQHAVNRFVNESIMNPMPEDKPAWASKFWTSPMYSILSFTMAFQRNVLFRNAKLAKRAVKERDAAIALGVIGPMATLFALQLAAYSIRFMIYGGSEDDLESEFGKEGPLGLPNWAWIGITRSGFLGITDPLFNAVYGIKYERDLANLALGPVYGRPVNTAARALSTVANNSPNTETVEFRAVEGIYDGIVGPAAVAAILRYGPAVHPWALVGAGAISVVTSKHARTAFAEMFYENPKDAKEKKAEPRFR